MFLGDELTEVLEAIEKDEPYGSREKELLKDRRSYAAEVPQRLHRPQQNLALCVYRQQV